VIVSTEQVPAGFLWWPSRFDRAVALGHSAVAHLKGWLQIVVDLGTQAKVPGIDTVAEFLEQPERVSIIVVDGDIWYDVTARGKGPFTPSVKF
jgi:hypothetical protein